MGIGVVFWNIYNTFCIFGKVCFLSLKVISLSALSLTELCSKIVH